MTLVTKIEKAKSKLMLEYPYLGSIASLLHVEEQEETDAFFCNGSTLYYNPNYVEEIQSDTLSFMLANGAMHHLFKHQERQSKRHGKRWQLAMDYTINAMLVENGMSLPDYVNYQSRFDKMYAEEIYAILLKESTDESDEESEETIDTPSENLSLSVEQETSELLLEQLFEKFSKQGELPKGLERVIPQAFIHTISWREMLYGYIASYAKSTYQFYPPNIKYLYRGIYLPALHSDLLHIVIALDTSGSIDNTLLSLFLSEVESIMQTYPNYQIELIESDSAIQSHKTFYAGEPLSYSLKGGGGTDFRPLFTYVEQYLDTPTILIYFTDAEGIFPQEAPSYDVLWVMTKEKEIPFGEVLTLEN